MKYLYTLFLLAFLLTACGGNEDYLYEVNPVEVMSVNADKKKQKTVEQYIAILHANLFQKAISANEMIEIRKLIDSIGDKELAIEIIISNFMNRPDIALPPNAEMRSDIDAFLTKTYKRFFIREPSEAEKAFMRNFIESDPNVSTEMVYFSFALSEEYRFY